MKIYENIVIGNFLFALGWAISAKKAGGPFGGAINLLQQTPADKLLGDLLVGFEGVVRLIEFKREGARMTKELGRHSLLTKAVAGGEMEAISREVHWYIETAASFPPMGISIYTSLKARTPVAAVEWNEAASEDGVLVKPVLAVYLEL